MSGGLTVALLVFSLAILLRGPGILWQLKAFSFGFFPILLMGVFDDLLGLRPLRKLLLQCVCAGATLAMLSFGGQVAANPAGLGFLMLWIVGVSNAFNLLDNMDGLAGGVGLVSSITVAFLFFSPAAPGEAHLDPAGRRIAGVSATQLQPRTRLPGRLWLARDWFSRSQPYLYTPTVWEHPTGGRVLPCSSLFWFRSPIRRS